MRSNDQEERKKILRILALTFIKYIEAVGPPINVEKMLKDPPKAFQEDFGIVEIYSNLWDAIFARPTSQRGSIFVSPTLPPDKRRFALAREILSALIDSTLGQATGLGEVLKGDLQESAEYFAGHLLAPNPMLETYRANGGNESSFANAFGIPEEIADQRWREGALENPRLM